ncbi:MAG: hypothetical protein FJ012_00305 [Chloroflexi bacterium]|nr:hypothetical protein [Chloroflexota bacterium]
MTQRPGGKKPHFRDKVLRCCDCGREFTFTAGEQVYFHSKSLSEPKRCKPCRQRRRTTLVPDHNRQDTFRRYSANQGSEKVGR